ncbi:unnamed protein product [Rotaria sordida]|uniref:Formin-binding protein 1-like protein n=1 Tax=Rotaria sordida TaxID=392033 RepID=A0A819I2Z4_9BILA|nr:unnamed protein product [Rotaria sordida]CAF3910240.1 unnamed protein product [Rotaria sordida]
MINQSWSIELWDQFENVSKYTEKSLQFCEKYESFLKERSTIEDDYAKALKKLTKTYAPKLKEQEEFYNKYSYTVAFCSTLKELHDLALQHEIIAENLREHTIKKVQLTIKECREQRKKCLDEYNKIKRQLDKQYDLLTKSLRKYEECFESARRAKENYEKAHEDLDLSRVQLEKARDLMTFKTKTCDDAHINYSSQVSQYNDIQHLFYEQQLPNILLDLQQLDQKRSDELKNIYFHFIQSHVEVLPRIQRCLDEMSKQMEQLNSYNDSQVVIDEYKSGYTIPSDEKVIDLNADDLPSILYNGHDQQIYNEFTRSNTLRSTNSECSHPNGIATIYAPSSHISRTQTLMRISGIKARKSNGATSTIRKFFGNSTQKKLSNTANNGMAMVNAPFSSLPPAQRMRKFQEQILNCKNELEKKQKAKEGLTKMKIVFQENPKFGDEQNVTQQIMTLDENIEKLLAEIKRFEAYISEIERARISTPSDIDLSLHSHPIYDSDQSTSNHNHSSSSQNRSSLYFRQHARKFMNINRRWSTTVCPPDIPEDNIYDQPNEFHCLPSITSMTVNQSDTTVHDGNGSFEDEDNDVDQTESSYHEPLNQENHIKACVLYDFNGLGINGCQYINAASINVGENVEILEDDRGDGWTRIKKSDGSAGFVPSSYIRIDSQILSTSSSLQMESGRF